jgi:hypothetical protein
MKRTIIIVLMAAVIVAICCAQACADRLVTVPTGNVLGKAAVKVEGISGFSDGSTTLVPFGEVFRAYWVNVGLGHIELEGTRYVNRGGDHKDCVSAELSILPETIVTPAVGIGVRDIGNEIERGEYVAVTKTIPLSDKIPLMPVRNIKVHAGYGVDGINGLFLGAQADLPMKLTLCVEETDSKFNASLACTIIPKLNLKLYSLDGEFFYGASFRAGL